MKSWLDWMGGRGCRDSEVIVMGRAKRFGEVENVANADWRSADAVDER